MPIVLVEVEGVFFRPTSIKVKGHGRWNILVEIDTSIYRGTYRVWAGDVVREYRQSVDVARGDELTVVIDVGLS